MANVFGTDNPETLDAADGVTNGADMIFGFNGDDIIFGLGGDDVILGGRGADTLNGGSGTDMVRYTDSLTGVNVFLTTNQGFGGTAEGDTYIGIESVMGSQQDDFLVGNDEHNVLSGLVGTDTLKGGGGADHLFGESGNDTLKGGGGADVLFGGTGIDTVDYFDSPAAVVISLITGIAGLGDAEGDFLTSIENVNGSAFADTLVGDDGVNVLVGRDGNDVLKGFGGNDTLRGDDGDDFMDGGIGADTMVGGLGNDSYVVDDALDAVNEMGGQGIDTVRTSVSWIMTDGADIETLETTDATGTAALALVGNANGNQIIGNDGDNTINGQGGIDQLIGRGGNDMYFVDNVSDEVIENGGQGNDQVRTSVNYTLTPGADVELLRPIFLTSTGAGNLTGNETGNSVVGNDGNNVLNGGSGNDSLTGRLGQDSFLFDTALSAAFNVDTITDFSVADDTIQLDDDVFSSSLGLGNISAGEFVIGGAALDANDRIIYNDASGALFYDSDGVGGTAQIQFATLSTGLALTNLDFLVVA
jgi:Ca2+-binding RTX toxin-like protein